jgi:uncharacterized protein involved in exopolysaccharide biosynthesis
MPNEYTARTKILQPQQNRSLSASIVGQLGASGGAGLGALDLLKDPNGMYIAMLRSQTILGHVVQQFDLRTRYRARTMTDAIARLEGATQITSDKDGTITVEVTDRDPKFAADVANDYIGELDRLGGKLALTNAARRRVFLEKQLVSTRQSLDEAASELQKTQEKSGLIQPEAQERVIMEALNSAHAKIAAKEVEIASIQSFATNKYPDLERAKSELAELNAQAAELESSKVIGNGEMRVPSRSIPAVATEYMKKYRDVKYDETFLELIMKQYEIAKADEAQDASLIQVLDPATPPERKSKPKRSLIVLVVTILAFFISVVWAFFSEAWQHAKADPEQSEKLKAIKLHLRSRLIPSFRLRT